MIVDTLTSPIILFFVLGMLAGFARSDLAIPEPFAKAMAIYLMAAIGLKGGVSIAANGLSRDLLMAGAAGIALSFIIPFPVSALLRTIGGLNRITAAATAAHYGSVSLVTYITAAEMLEEAGMPAAAFMAAVLAMMETPAIISGIMLAHRPAAGGRSMWREVFLNGSVVLLLGALLIGLIAGSKNFEPIKPVFESGYRGVLCLFLLDMGLIASRRLSDSRAMTGRLVAIGVLVPLINGMIGTCIGTLLGLDVGTAAILGILAASASYIAVPAAMRLALPEADPGIYLSMSLGITFPFNVIVNIALISQFALWIARL